MSTPATPTTSHGVSGSSANLAPGVQMLLDAEKEANRQVQQARQSKSANYHIAVIIVIVRSSSTIKGCSK